MRRTSLAMIFKLGKHAEKRWRRLDGHGQITLLLQGKKSLNSLNNGINGLYYSLPKPSVGRVIVFTTMPDQKEIQCVWSVDRTKQAIDNLFKEYAMIPALKELTHLQLVHLGEASTLPLR